MRASAATPKNKSSTAVYTSVFLPGCDRPSFYRRALVQPHGPRPQEPNAMLRKIRNFCMNPTSHQLYPEYRDLLEAEKTRTIHGIPHCDQTQQPFGPKICIRYCIRIKALCVLSSCRPYWKRGQSTDQWWGRAPNHIQETTPEPR